MIDIVIVSGTTAGAGGAIRRIIVNAVKRYNQNPGPNTIITPSGSRIETAVENAIRSYADKQRFPSIEKQRYIEELKRKVLERVEIAGIAESDIGNIIIEVAPMWMADP